jgi:hypothetical protein
MIPNVTEESRMRQGDATDQGPRREADSSVFEEVRDRLEALAHELRELAAIKVAKVKLSVAESLFRIATLVFAALFALVVIVTSVVLLLSGIAGWIGSAAGAPWIGQLVTGLVFILLVVVAFLAAKAKIRKKVTRVEP